MNVEQRLNALISVSFALWAILCHITCMDYSITTPHRLESAAAIFGIDSPIQIPILEGDDEHVPPINPHYHFDATATRAILASFLYGRNLLLHGLHGTGKSTHIEQVAARLNWPLVRINLDGHVSRMDLIGRDVISLRDGKQVTEFQEGMLPWALGRACALLFDEYDAARPDVLFVLQRILESDGKLTLLDQNRVLTPHPEFRLLATANTVGLGDPTGMYHGANPLNQGQMDRWQMIVKLDYFPLEQEVHIVQAYVADMSKEEVTHMVTLAGLLRTAFMHGDLSTVLSPRSVIHWAENFAIFQDRELAFRYAFLERCDEAEYPLIAELYQRVYNVALLEAVKAAA